MRTDCTRDNKRVPLPNASHIGFATWYAKRGYWLRYRQENSTYLARVINRVKADGKIYIEVAAILDADFHPFIRWIQADDVIECYDRPPRQALDFITGDWSHPDAIMQRIEYGFLDQRYVDEKNAA